MTSPASFSLRSLGRLFRAPRVGLPPSAGRATVLDGVCAVALTEAGICESAALGASYPAAAGARAWDDQREHSSVNVLGQPLTSVCVGEPRGALAAALGLALGGQRATVFLSGPDLMAVQDLLGQAVGQRVPLVIHLACRSAVGHAEALGTGHEAYHAARDRGLIQLFAINAQEAADLTLIARCVSEICLVPALVAMDAEQTAAALQDVRLPDDQLVQSLIGESSARIESPTEAQRFLFGDERRRVPRLHNLDRPMMLSPLQGSESWPLGAAGGRPYFADHVQGALCEAFDVFAAQAGRKYAPCFEHEVDGANIVLVAQGSAVETAVAVADRLRTLERLKVGVLGIRCLRPFPADQLATWLAGAEVVAVLERVDTPLAGDGPVLLELRAALDRNRASARSGRRRPAPGTPDRPHLVNVPFGLGGLPLRTADLSTLIRTLSNETPPLIYLGLQFGGATSSFPKRQAVLDAVHRCYAQLDTLGLRSSDPPPDVRPEGATTIAIHRLAGDAMESVSAESAALIHGALGGGLRSRPCLTWQRFDQACVDYVTHAPGRLCDPGDDVSADIAVVASRRVHPHMSLAHRLVPNGAILLATEYPAIEPCGSLPPHVCRDLRHKNIRLYVVSLPRDDGGRPGLLNEILLGGLTALFMRRLDDHERVRRKFRSAREALLQDVPEQERAHRLEAFLAAMEGIEPVDLETFQPPKAGASPTGIPTPPSVRRLGRSDNTLDCLPRFWGQTGALYRAGATDELTADPYQAMGAVPPISSTFRDVSTSRKRLPIFDPQTADGHGRLWTTCPDASVVPLVISPRALVNAGVELAAARGRPADALRGIAGQLAQRVSRIVKSRDANTAAHTAADLLREAFDHLVEKTQMPESRKDSLQEALEIVMDQVGELSLVRTPVFFDELERASGGSGELFGLIVNPDACKSVALLLEVCGGRGLKAVEQTPRELEKARRLWDLWQQLPDTSGQTIERVRAHPGVGPLAAVMLSRHCQLAMAAGDAAEAGSGARLGLSRVLAVAEFHLQPKLQEHLDRIELLRGKLGERIRESLADALPVADLDALAEGLDLLGQTKVDLTTLAGKVDAAVTDRRVDAAQLGRLVEVARGLADLHWRLAKGPDGLGRARAGLAIAPGTVSSWAGVFPHNPFQVPVVIDACGETAALARGLVEGQLHQALGGFRLLRWAELELDEPAEAAGAVEALRGLRFCDLKASERKLCPPLLLIADGAFLASRGLSQVVGLLNSDLPVKLIVLSDIGGKSDGGSCLNALDRYPTAPDVDLALLALLCRRAFVVQNSLAFDRQFVEGLLGALAFDGPAFVHIHAPSPERHGFDPSRLHGQAQLAVRSRAFPLFTFDPSAAGVFGSCLDLSSNPDVDAPWSGGEDGRPLTPVDWMVTEQRFAPFLRPLADVDPQPTPVAEYLELGADDRDGRTPFVATCQGDQSRRLVVGPPLVADADERGRLWRVLQELAGVVTPFTKNVRQEAERELAEHGQTQLDALKQQYESRLAELKDSFETEATKRVAGRLMTLAGYAARQGRDGDKGT